MSCSLAYFAILPPFECKSIALPREWCHLTRTGLSINWIVSIFPSLNGKQFVRSIHPSPPPPPPSDAAPNVTASAAAHVYKCQFGTCIIANVCWFSIHHRPLLSGSCWWSARRENRSHYPTDCGDCGVATRETRQDKWQTTPLQLHSPCRRVLALGLTGS